MKLSDLKQEREEEESSLENEREREKKRLRQLESSYEDSLLCGICACML